MPIGQSYFFYFFGNYIVRLEYSIPVNKCQLTLKVKRRLKCKLKFNEQVLRLIYISFPV